MRPYLTIILDSYRMLKASTIFWVTFGISLLVALVYLSMGFNDEGITLFFGLVPIENELFRAGTRASEILYVTLFTKMIAEYWLSWIAVLLALISCSSVFVEALKEGTAGMELTKKLSRPKVFVAKFLGSMLFVLIPVLLFVLIVFVALGWRLGSWNPTIFWYVPLIMLVFFYLYSFLVLIAVMTRSTMTALVLTLVVWAVSSMLGVVEGQLYTALKDSESTAQAGLAQEEEMLENAEKIYAGIKTAYAIFPKTGRTMEVADRLLVVNGERGIAKGTFTSNMMKIYLEDAMNSPPVDDGAMENMDPEMEELQRESVKQAEMMTSRHSVPYSIGTSALFALVMLGLAAWFFSRKEI